ncbi:succinate dehydrogenase, cytochrome b556 subunit [Tranquillimonas alkanivorans]|uniref:Succinate dehydrogenase cytochrome b556 subunit n=1 Tax=Tranquillimonas alkanivorans TaxID=441119 RepID=A0A1I5PGW4_9RHOB|nr:succinate dehydrogenase, cytochrome b556 subunit [Tranquillimonas alkanivorans]SFP32791.1 succinate dehydrogenase subunit C [Tranquillimonas alkanivorans]
MPDVNRGDRPLSPFMIGPYYRPQITSISSIFTRITGNGLLVGALLVVWWLLAAATSPEAFATADGFITSWFGDLIMFLSLLALWYHTLAGLRHLYWDTGRGLEIGIAEKLGWGCMIGSVVLTVFTVIVI